MIANRIRAQQIKLLVRDPLRYAIHVTILQLGADNYLVTALALAVEHSDPETTLRETVTAASLAEARSAQTALAVELSRRLSAQGNQVVDVYTSL